MSLDFWTGFSTSLALIVAIGSQNAFVLRQGIRREHVLPLVMFCALSDAALIMAGIGGAGVFIQGSALLLNMAKFGGAAFLAVYGFLAAQRAWRGSAMHLGNTAAVSLQAALVLCFGFTFLNPHVYLDTIVLLGSVGNQRAQPWVFGWGACLASLCWFAALGYGARWLAPWFEKPIAWRILDSLIALCMGALSLMLLMGH